MAITIDGTGTISGVSATGITTAQTVLAVTGPAFRATTASQSFTSGVTTKVLFPTEEFDTNSNFASSRFTPTVAGYYQINSSIFIGSASSLTNAYVQCFKNGVAGTTGLAFQNGFGVSVNVGLTYSDIFYCNGTTDYLEIYATVTGVSPSTSLATFSGAIVRAA